jgi:hypothetical protein
MMISFKSFVQAIHDAVLQANNTLMDKNQDILKKYFEDSERPGGEDEEPIKTLKPRTVTLEYPHLDTDGNLQLTEILVPIFTLAPLNMSQIEKVTLTSEFEMQVKDGELEIEFSDRKSGGIFSRRRDTKSGKIEIVVTPQDTAEGVKILVEAYENVLKRQL